MALSGDVAIPATGLRIDRSIFFPPYTNTDKNSITLGIKTTMGFSVNTTRPLNGQPTKRKGFQRKKGTNRVMETIPQATAVAYVPVSTKAKHIDLLEAVSQRDCDSQPLVSNSFGTLNSGSGYGLERSNTGEEAKSPALGSDQLYHKYSYNEIPLPSYALFGEEQEKNTAVQEELARANALTQRQIELPQGLMELPFRFSLRDRRPKIQLTIPRTHSQAYAVVPQDGDKEKQSASQDTPKTVSPPSATTRQNIDSEGPPARLSVVSPISIMQMPTPRRPFSTFSWEEMSSDMLDSKALLSKSASSDSSDDTGENDDRSSNYSPRSSVSSLTSDPCVVKSLKVKGSRAGFSVISPTAAGVFDSAHRTSAFQKPPRVLKSSTLTIDWADRNKPLPPEPGPEAVKPLKFSATSFSRTNSMKARGRTPTPLSVARQSTVNMPIHRTSLRSKYTPADLDAIDHAFERTSPHNHLHLVYAHPSSPTLSQAELELEAQLCSIHEDVSLVSQVVPTVQDPLQISRGPMHMEPSRKAPSPPQSQYSGEGPLGSRRRLQKKPSRHVALQMRPGMARNGSLRSRISAPVLGSNSKAHRVLGRIGTEDFVGDFSAESRWDSSSSPHSSPTMSMDDSDAPESDVSPIIPDATFEEVRQRLELLSPKDDASQVFLEFHEKYLSGDSFPPSPLQERHDSHSFPDANYEKTSNHAISTEPEPSTPLIGQNPRLEVTPAPERINASSTPEGCSHVDALSIRSLGSITASEIPEIYASLPSPKTAIRRSLTKELSAEEVLTQEEVERMISADAAEKVLLRILEHLDNLQDLFATATVSRGFYRTFKRHELPLMKNALHGMSPAAWELREMTPPYPGSKVNADASPKIGYTPTLYLQHYMRDMYTMIALKSMILVHCESFLRADTIIALAGGETDRASQIDDAFWRVWTFCRVFGCRTNKEDDIIGQMDWLRGGILAKQQRRNASTIEIGDTNSAIIDAPTCFGQGNSGGLSAEDLYDMTEIWTCLGVLVRGFQGKRQFARDFGVFDNSNIVPGDVEREDAELEEWTYHLLTLAPPTVLDITSPNSPTATTFDHARKQGYTTWSPPSMGASRSTFLKEAISRVYHEKMLQRHPTIQVVTCEPESGSTPISAENVLTPRQRIAAHAQEIRAKRNDPAFKSVLPSEERPMSNFPEVLSKLENTTPIVESPSSITSSTLPPSAYCYPYPRSTTSSSVQTESQTQRWPSTPETQFMSNINVPLSPQVRDPVDVAVENLIKMGFDEGKAKKALAKTDSGNSIDFDKAVELLVRERKRNVCNLMHSNYRGATGEDEQRASASPNQAYGLGIGIAERYA